jgi:hypothetical protein
VSERRERTVNAVSDVAAALRGFADRIGPLYPPSPGPGVELRVDDVAVVLAGPVARALVEALRAYHDPNDRGSCDHCGGRRIDGNFLCADCGQPSGVFGQLVRERAARYPGPPPEIG